MSIIDKDWLKVNLSEAERQLKHWQKRLDDLRSADRLFEEENKKETSKENDSEITQADLKKYLGTPTPSQGRIKFFKELIRKKGRPLHYNNDFWNEISRLGDRIQKDSFYVILRKNAERFGLENIGGGSYKIK